MDLVVEDVLLEASEGDSAITVVPTIATLVVVGSGVTVTATPIVVEDVAAAWGVEDVDVVAAAWGVEVVELEVVELVLALVEDVLAAPDWPAYATPCPSLEDELPPAFEQMVWTPSLAKNKPINVLRYALVPAQSSFKLFERSSRKPMHFAEQPCPEKSELEQSVRGVL